MSTFYWERHPDGPFATLIAVAATYCTPEAYDSAYDDLIGRARAPEPDDEEIRALKVELQHALADPGQLPADELAARRRLRRRQRGGVPAAACGMT